jgi:hypothetical protein
MTDTIRTLDALVALLADNAVGDIDAQDLRDMLVSLAPGHGMLYLATPAANVLSDTTTWVQVGGAFTLSGSAYNWAETDEGQLHYDSAGDRDAHVTATLSVTSASVSQILEFAIALNGTPVTGSPILHKTGTGGDVISISLTSHVDVSDGDYISLMLRNTSSASNVTVSRCVLVVNDMPDED